MNRRVMLASSALVPLAACTLPAGAAPTIPQIVATVQAWMPYVSAGILAAAVFVPALAPYLPAIQSGLNVVSAILATLSSGMTTTQAQPIGQQIVTAIQAVMTNVHQAVAAMPSGETTVQIQNLLAEADTAAAVITALVQSMTGTATQAPGTMPDLYVTVVR